MDAKVLKEEDVEALKAGFANMDRHVENLRKFGQSVVICINRFPTDTDLEIETIRVLPELNLPFAVNNAFSQGGDGATDLAKVVVETIEKNPSKPLELLYDLNESIKDKVGKITSTIYRASGVQYESSVTKKIKTLEEQGYDKYPVCIAKTQYSFTDDAKR